MAWRKAVMWPAAKAGNPEVSRSDEVHVLASSCGGGARGRAQPSKVSMMNMGPPQHGQGWVLPGNSLVSGLSSVSS